MLKLNFSIGCVLIACCAFGKGMLPSQVHRYGLTNTQIDDLFAKHPTAELRLTAQDWRAMRYQLHRFGNMTNYVEAVADAPGCAKLVLDLTDKADELTAEAKVLRTNAANATRRAEDAEARAAENEADAAALREIRKQAKRTEKNLAKVVKALEQAQKKAASEDEQQLYGMLIAVLEGGGGGNDD